MSRDDHRRHDRELERLRQELAQRSRQSTTSSSPRELAVLVIGTAIGIGGLFTDDVVVRVGCVVVALIAIVLACYFHPGAKLWRSIVAIGAIVVFLGLLVRAHRHDLKKAQDDVLGKLTLTPFLPSSRNIAKLGVTVTNHGGFDIKDHTIRCEVERINRAPRGVFDGFSLQANPPKRSNIKANGDAETNFCTAALGDSVLPFACADITVTVTYALSIQPEIENSKELRFVMRSEDEMWHQQNVDSPGSYCPQDWPL
jgi:hypothetical protein